MRATPIEVSLQTRAGGSGIDRIRWSSASVSAGRRHTCNWPRFHLELGLSSDHCVCVFADRLGDRDRSRNKSVQRRSSAALLCPVQAVGARPHLGCATWRRIGDRYSAGGSVSVKVAPPPGVSPTLTLPLCAFMIS